jgi:hypothetical protein
MLQVNQRTTHPDLGRALRDERGTFLCQNRGQNYLAVSEEGHSIVSFRPVGDAVPVASIASDQWTITKISDTIDASYESREQRDRERTRSAV